MEMSKSSPTWRAKVHELAGNHHCLITADQHFRSPAAYERSGFPSHTPQKRPTCVEGVEREGEKEKSS